MNVLIVLIRWVKAWYLLFGCFVIKDKASITDDDDDDDGDNDDDDDGDNDKLFCGWLTDERHLPLFATETIVRDPFHRESWTRRDLLIFKSFWFRAILITHTADELTYTLAS